MLDDPKRPTTDDRLVPGAKPRPDREAVRRFVVGILQGSALGAAFVIGVSVLAHGVIVLLL